MTRLFVISFVLVIANAVLAQTNQLPEKITIEGVTYENIRWEKPTPASVEIRYKSGIATIPLRKLPKELQEQFGYDPQKAAAFEEAERSAVAERNAAAASQVAESLTNRAPERIRLGDRRPDLFKRYGDKEYSYESGDVRVGVRVQQAGEMAQGSSAEGVVTRISVSAIRGELSDHAITTILEDNGGFWVEINDKEFAPADVPWSRSGSLPVRSRDGTRMGHAGRDGVSLQLKTQAEKVEY